MKLYQLVRQARRLAPHIMPKGPKAVLTCLIEHSNKNGDGTQSYPGIKTIAEECSCSERHAQRCLRWLEAEGWISVLDSKGGKGKFASYHLVLDQFGWLEARPPTPAEPVEIDPARRLRFARGILKRLAADSPVRDKWEQEVAELEQRLAGEASPPPPTNNQAAHLPEIPETPAPRNLPATINYQRQVTLLSEEDFNQLEIAYFGSMAAQAREPRGSPDWCKWQPYVRQLRDNYNAALQARGIVASDGHEPPMDAELEEQIQEDQRAQWLEEERKLRSLIDERTKKRDALKPGSMGWRMYNSLINQAINNLKDGNGFFEQEGYVT